MLRNIAVTVAMLVGVAFGYAQDMRDTTSQKGMATDETVTLSGYVVDAMCAQGMVKKGNVMERAAKHTKECALEDDCSASGYGIMTGGKYVKFDSHGDELAQNLLQKTEKDSAIAVHVSGKMVGNKLAVASLKETTLDKTQGGNKADVKEGAVEGQQP
jgi:hypothetical protein